MSQSGSFTFPSRPRAAGSAYGSEASSSASSVFPPPPGTGYSRPLPSFGNPNIFPSPPSHYFPSAPRSARTTAQGRRRPGGGTEDTRDNILPPSPSPPPADHDQPIVPADENGRPRFTFPGRTTARPKKGSGVGAARRQEWNAASEALRELDEEDEAMGDLPPREGEAEEGEDELDDGMMDLDGAPGAAARLKEQQELGDQAGEPAKKRSRTLTTPQQTRVLNALLAKTRFPSTETRQQVGQEIGMSARRVQIWFQNRRQSQKRARDREASEGVPPGTYTDQLNPNPTFPLAGGTQPSYAAHSHQGFGHPGQQPYPTPHGAHTHSHAQAHAYPLSTHAVSPYLRTDPYARYPPPGEPSSRAQIHQHHRGRVSRQGSIDSIASVASLHSQATRISRDTDTLAPLPNDRNRSWPVSSNIGWPGPINSPPMSPVSDRGESNGGTQLPSLFSVLNGPGGPGEPQPSRSHAFSPGPADDFSRLAISQQDRPASGAGGDMLDKAVAVVNVPRAAPVKDSLPPLRVALGAAAFDSPAPLPPRGEADQALLAPILPRIDSSGSATSSSRTGTRLPSLASITTTFAPQPSIFPSHTHSSASTITQTPHFADNTPPATHHAFTNGNDSDSPPSSHSPPAEAAHSPFAHRASTWSTASAAPTAYSFPSQVGTQGGRSSVSSLDTTGTWARGADAKDVTGWGAVQPTNGNGIGNGHGPAHGHGHGLAGTGKENGVGQEAGAGRASFSSEVQEEWERYNAGRKASGGGLGMEGREVRLQRSEGGSGEEGMCAGRAAAIHSLPLA